ncbi:MAG: hypothetical protein JXA69_13945 [Phycisphaerae bacterium]|nr:hypothetical protein [Phycisphaerae bacterium]
MMEMRDATTREMQRSSSTPGGVATARVADLEARRARRQPLQLCAFALMSLGLISSARAHRVSADAYVSDDGRTITVDAWFSGGKTPKDGVVIVLRPDGTEIQRGPLLDGAFEFTPDRAEALTFNIQLGEGHAARVTLTDEQIARLRIPEAGTDAPAVVAHDTRPQDARIAHPHGAARETATETTLRVLVGLAVIAALTALAMAIATNRRLRRVEQTLTASHENRNDRASS